MNFNETDQPITPYEGHHLAVNVADFSGPHAWLNARGLVSAESAPYQYRFEQIIDPATNEPLFGIQHEVRSLTHPMYTRHLNLVNHNPEQNQMAYLPGRDFYVA